MVFPILDINDLAGYLKERQRKNRAAEELDRHFKIGMATVIGV